MDPDATLAEMLDLAAVSEVVDLTTRDADRLAALVMAMHGWIEGGGFLPAAWRATVGATPPVTRERCTCTAQGGAPYTSGCAVHDR